MSIRILTRTEVQVCVCVRPPSVSSEEVIGRLAVQRELAGAVAGHADPHETQQDGHARHHRGLPALQHSLGCLSLKERAGVTTATTGCYHRQGPRQRASSVPPGSGCCGVLKEVILVTHLSHPSDGFTVREESHYNLHFVKFQHILNQLIQSLPVCQSSAGLGASQKFEPIQDLS